MKDTLTLAVQLFEKRTQGTGRWESLTANERTEWFQVAEFVESIPIPMRITCPECGKLHIDEGEFETKPHHTHACQNCGLTWRPSVRNTVGVRFLPGFGGS